MNIEKTFKNFIRPQHTVAEILLASILTITTIVFVFVKQSFILEFFPGVILTLILSLCTLRYSILVIFFKKSNFNRLKILQILGMILILIISFCYVITSFVFMDLNSAIDYVFIFYALLTVIRIVVIAGIIKASSFKELGRHIDDMPLAKNNYLTHSLIFIILFTFYIYFQNIEILSIALGKSFYVGLFGLEIIREIYKTKK